MKLKCNFELEIGTSEITFVIALVQYLQYLATL
jgi:hypothetical protein